MREMSFLAPVMNWTKSGPFRIGGIAAKHIRKILESHSVGLKPAPPQLLFSHMAQLVGFYFPNQGSNLGPGSKSTES